MSKGCKAEMEELTQYGWKAERKKGQVTKDEAVAKSRANHSNLMAHDKCFWMLYTDKQVSLLEAVAVPPIKHVLRNKTQT